MLIKKKKLTKIKKSEEEAELKNPDFVKTLRSIGTIYKSPTNRTINGFLESGASGEKGKIYDRKKGIDVFDMEKEHAKMIPTFYHIYIPVSRKYTFVILQRQSSHGIKTLFTSALQKYVNSLGIKNLQVTIDNFLVSKIFDKYIEEGRFHEMSFIKNVIPDNIEDLYDRGHDRVAGKVTTTVTAAKNKSLPIKSFINNLYRRPNKDAMIKVEGHSESFDEIDVEIDYNGTKKTIHMSNVGRTLPYYNVTSKLDFIDDVPTIESLKAQSDILIDDMKLAYEPKTDE